MSLTIQKANFWKRISAFLFDFILTVMLAVGIATIFSAAFNYDSYNQKASEYYAYHEQVIETQFGVDFDVLESEEEYEKLTEDQKENYQNAVEAFNKALSEDTRVAAVYKKMLVLSLAIVSLSLFLSILGLQFIVPLLLKDGRTLGKKIFGLSVVRSNCVKVSNPILFIRAMLGVYTIETMFPVSIIILIYFGVMGIVGTITVALLLLLQIGVLIASRYRSAIHDLLTDTVVVDYASQRTFRTQEDLLAYKQRLHEEEVAQKEYS